MKTIKWMSIAALGTFMTFCSPALKAQDNTATSQERNPGSFTGILMESPVKYYLNQGAAEAVRIEGPAEILEKVKTEVKNGILTFSFDNKYSEDLRIYITARELNSIEISGASVLEGQGIIKSPVFRLEASDAAMVNLELETGQLTSDISGAASVKLKGSADRHTADVSGASNLLATDLVSKSTIIDVSGAGNAKIDATEELKADVSGAGTLYNKSQPGNVDVDQSGAGSVVTDTTRFRFGEKQFMYFNGDKSCKAGERKHGSPFCTKDNVKPQWMGLELGFNGYVNSDFGFDPPAGYGFFEPNYGRSFSVGLNIFEYGVPLVKKHMTLVTGLGFEINNYQYRNNYIMLADTSMLTGQIVPGADYKSNKLGISWVRIPILLQFDSKQSKKGNSFHFSMGVIGALKIKSHTKQVWDIDDSRYRVVTRDDFNLNPFKADATVRIGYGYLNLFVNYSLTSMFRKGEGPKLFPVSAGITLLNF